MEHFQFFTPVQTRWGCSTVWIFDDFFSMSFYTIYHIWSQTNIEWLLLQLVVGIFVDLLAYYAFYSIEWLLLQLVVVGYMVYFSRFTGL